jgi:hypothetical protein
MKSFKSYMNESFINLFDNPKDIEKKRAMADEVWDMITKTYAYVGGLHGNGYENKEAMIQKIPFWKIVRKNGKIIALHLYKTKDEQGRKGSASATDGSAEGKKALLDMFYADLKFNRSWTEVSGKVWSFLKRNVPVDVLKTSILDPKIVQKFLPHDDIIPAYGKDPDIASDDPYKDYYYMRFIDAAGKTVTKIALGKPGVLFR